jgi:hypothetical protein
MDPALVNVPSVVVSMISPVFSGVEGFLLVN